MLALNNICNGPNAFVNKVKRILKYESVFKWMYCEIILIFTYLTKYWL